MIRGGRQQVTASKNHETSDNLRQEIAHENSNQASKKVKKKQPETAKRVTRQKNTAVASSIPVSKSSQMLSTLSRGTGKKPRKPHNKGRTAAQAQGKTIGRWTDEEHERFLEGKSSPHFKSSIRAVCLVFSGLI